MTIWDFFDKHPVEYVLTAWFGMCAMVAVTGIVFIYKSR